MPFQERPQETIELLRAAAKWPADACTTHCGECRRGALVKVRPLGDDICELVIRQAQLGEFGRSGAPSQRGARLAGVVDITSRSGFERCEGELAARIEGAGEQPE